MWLGSGWLWNLWSCVSGPVIVRCCGASELPWTWRGVDLCTELVSPCDWLVGLVVLCWCGQEGDPQVNLVTFDHAALVTSSAWVTRKAVWPWFHPHRAYHRFHRHHCIYFASPSSEVLIFIVKSEMAESCEWTNLRVLLLELLWLSCEQSLRAVLWKCMVVIVCCSAELTYGFAVLSWGDNCM